MVVGSGGSEPNLWWCILKSSRDMDEYCKAWLVCYFSLLHAIAFADIPFCNRASYPTRTSKPLSSARAELEVGIVLLLYHDEL